MPQRQPKSSKENLSVNKVGREFQRKNSRYSELCLVSRFRMPLYPFNLCVENKFALSNRSQHFASLRISHAEKSEVGRDLRGIKTATVLF